jgi:hypothetical protein
MSPEAAPSVPRVESQSETDQSIIKLQEALEVGESQARDIASIQVGCPIPGENRQSSLGEFMNSPHGAEKADEILEIAQDARRDGASAEKAMSQALGFSAVRDKETGNLLRVPSEQNPVENEDIAQDAKKKLN